MKCAHKIKNKQTNPQATAGQVFSPSLYHDLNSSSPPFTLKILVIPLGPLGRSKSAEEHLKFHLLSLISLFHMTEHIQKFLGLRCTIGGAFYHS